MSLRLDWCSSEAATFAVKNWHYSKSFNIHPNIRIGVWEDSAFVGAIIYARGANKALGSPYGLKDTECAELVRVALNDHRTPVSRILSIAQKMLAKKEQGLRLLVSFADTNQGHHGGIYQASGWIYAGMTPAATAYKTKDGKILHSREVSVTGVKPYFGEMRRVPKRGDCVPIKLPPKHRYLMPLDEEMRKQIAPLAKPYPKRPKDLDSVPTERGRGGTDPDAPICHGTKA